MASPSKQAPPTQKKGGGGWGSLLSGAVAGLESRLDTILADDTEAGAKARATESRPGTGGSLAPPKASTGDRARSREARGNDRLAERLAKAAAARTPTGSAVPSRTVTPANGTDSARQRWEESRSLDLVRSVPDIAEPAHTADEEEGASATNEQDKATGDDGSVPNGSRISVDSSRPSLEAISSRPSAELPNGTTTAPNLTQASSSVEADLTTTASARQQQDLHTYMEKIDALQAKLSYLANETVAAAKAANAESSPNSTEAKLAEKDERVALLMQEGEKLSKTELGHLQTIKKLRAQGSEAENATAEAKRKYEKGEARLRKAEQEARTTAEERKVVVVGLEKQVEELRTERANAVELVKTLTAQLKEAKERAEKAEREKGANGGDKNRIAALENDVEDARIEKRLAEDRAASEVKRVREEFEAQKQRFGVRELELKNDVAGLEARVEAVRARAEESAGHGGTGESGVQLLRQVETLQRQYVHAKANWDAIEGSLNGRVAALERERDEAGRREAEARKRFRDVGSKARRAEEELEVKVEAVRGLEEDAKRLTELVEELRRRLEERERVVEDVRNEAERQRGVWEAETQHRIEEERLKWQQQQRAQQRAPSTFRTQSPANNPRKMSTVDVNASTSRRPGPGNRLTSHDLAALHTFQSPSRLSSGRGSAIPTAAGRTQAFVNHNFSEASPPAISRQESAISLATPTAADNIPLPDTHNHHNNAPSETFPDSPADTPTIADLVSTSAGPSVQLVERMSLLVRRLESEKAGFKDEIMRLSGQRDSARDEVVALMREVEAKRAVEAEAKGLREVRGRYEAALEMLGEREEEAEELRGDVRELKRLYRELVEGKMGAAITQRNEP
ncbi:hypothetical protein LTR37_018874 [Vermiconidia calcicola]|uniref:Uncharacterized protein n=1 Tax=Vermiconidia calcicola TaxID=1690605 RepID=A0ACC3MHK1_9PEZI|nr:hypothetical protein LTR37_018874 [Vermiconidia calcicola]